MLKRIKKIMAWLKNNFLCECCYDDQEYSGHAAMGCCSGLTGCDMALCKGCYHYTTVVHAEDCETEQKIIVLLDEGGQPLQLICFLILVLITILTHS